jgi:hypothetical protein
MHTSLKWLITASLVNLVGNSLGAVISLGQNLAADWGGSLNGQDVLRDFLGFKGTALSAPLSFMLIQLVITLFALRPGRLGKVGVGGLTFIGLFYTLAQIGEPIVLRQFKVGDFDLMQSLTLLRNTGSAIAMLILGIRAGRSRQTPEAVAMT